MARILVVDDEIGIRELLSEILYDEGHTVELAENAAEARAARQRYRPDLVLLDIWMPDTDGVSLLKEWAARPARHARHHDERPRHRRHGGGSHPYRRGGLPRKTHHPAEVAEDDFLGTGSSVGQRGRRS